MTTIRPPRAPRRSTPFRSPSFLGRLFSILLGLFLYAPIFVMIVYSFNDSKSRTVWAGFTLSWYKELFTNSLILSALSTTLSVAFIATAISTVVGTIAAIGIHQHKGFPKSALLTLNNLPVISPDIITGVSFRMLFLVVLSILGSWGLNFSLGYGTLLLSHLAFCIPYVILSVMPKLSQMGKHVYEAALDLGATPAMALRKVIFPEILPGIISGALIAFTMSIDDFMISFFTSGDSVQTLPIYVYSMTRRRMSPEINALSTLMFIAVLLLLVGINVFQAKDAKKNRV